MFTATDINTLVATTTAYTSDTLLGVLPTIVIWVVGAAILFMAIGWVLGIFRRRRH